MRSIKENRLQWMTIAAGLVLVVVTSLMIADIVLNAARGIGWYSLILMAALLLAGAAVAWTEAVKRTALNFDSSKPRRKPGLAARVTIKRTGRAGADGTSAMRSRHHRA